MLLFRLGPRYLFIRTEYIEEITNFLESNIKGRVTNISTGFEEASENSTLCFITGTGHEKTRVEDAKKIVLVNKASTLILTSLINNKVCHLLNRVDLGPASVVMRIAGDENKLIGRIKEMLSGKEVELIEGIALGEREDTIIVFTKKAITGPVAPRDFLKTKLLIPKPIREVQETLRLQVLRLITQSLDEGQWYELRINIYDSHGRYEENYNRLIYILSRLELGMILGESWTKDYAVMLLSVLTYQVRLFTFSPPQEVKKILMALEYTSDGERLVDFDLYYKNKKIHWNQVSNSKGRKNKVEMARAFRKALYEKLKPEEIETLESMEAKLVDEGTSNLPTN
ncbi:MAG: hypothetical protein GXZ06_08430 [Tissierellia bacterium]|nr:hypothetical protein [Tissierellia bacterium]